MNNIDKFSEIQSSENHDLIIVNFIFMNNFYFLNVVKNSISTENSSMQVNIVTADKKSNQKQQQNMMRLIKI